MKPLLPILAAAWCAAAACAAPSLTATAEGFYGVYSVLHPLSGIPDKAARARYAPYLSPDLLRLLDRAAAVQSDFAKGLKGAPPIIEGDIFTSMFDGATAERVTGCKDDGKSGTCSVDLSYDDKHHPPVRWTDTLYLVLTPQGWRIDDVGYGGSGQFSNKGRLTATLRQAISDAGG